MPGGTTSRGPGLTAGSEVPPRHEPRDPGHTGDGEAARNADPPTDADIQETTEKAHLRYYPVIRQPELSYGWFQKGKGCRIWCKACRVWLGVWRLEPDTYELAASEDGHCPH